MKYPSQIVALVLFGGIFACGLSGCLLAAAGAGAEGGYIVAQEDRSAQETVQDQYLVSTIKTKLLAAQDVPGMDINVDAFKGNITLRGALKDQKQIDRAVELARNVDGVKSLESKLVVIP